MQKITRALKYLRGRHLKGPPGPRRARLSHQPHSRALRSLVRDGPAPWGPQCCRPCAIPARAQLGPRPPGSRPGLRAQGLRVGDTAHSGPWPRSKAGEPDACASKGYKGRLLSSQCCSHLSPPNPVLRWVPPHTLCLSSLRPGVPELKAGAEDLLSCPGRRWGQQGGGGAGLGGD